MAKTLQELRREVGKNLRLCTSGVVDEDPSSDYSALKDADVLPMFNDNWWTKGYAYFSSLGPTIARVTGFASGIVRFAPALTETTLNNAYELWKSFDPRDVNDAINDILTKRAVQHVQVASAFVAAQYAGYSVPTLANRMIELEYLDANNQYSQIKSYKVLGTPGNLTFDLLGDARGLVSAYPTGTLRITYERNYPALATEGATTDCPDAWLTAATIADLYRGMLSRTQKADRDQIIQNIGVYEAEASRYAGVHRGTSSGARVIITPKVTR